MDIYIGRSFQRCGAGTEKPHQPYCSISGMVQLVVVVVMGVCGGAIWIFFGRIFVSSKFMLTLHLIYIYIYLYISFVPLPGKIADASGSSSSFI